MDIQTIIRELGKPVPGGQRIRVDYKFQIGETKYKMVAYKIESQGLVRIDIKEEG